jgi:F1F0 ATPase subunit 2
MAMNEAMTLLLALSGGVLLGIGFFGGLWWTVQRCLASRRTALWLLVGFLLRAGIVVAGFYFISNGHWERLLACLLGFIIARFGVVRWSRTPVESGGSRPKEAGHAP